MSYTRPILYPTNTKLIRNFDPSRGRWSEAPLPVKSAGCGGCLGYNNNIIYYLLLLIIIFLSLIGLPFSRHAFRPDVRRLSVTPTPVMFACAAPLHVPSAEPRAPGRWAARGGQPCPLFIHMART